MDFVKPCSVQTVHEVIAVPLVDIDLPAHYIRTGYYVIEVKYFQIKVHVSKSALRSCLPTL